VRVDSIELNKWIPCGKLEIQTKQQACKLFKYKKMQLHVFEKSEQKVNYFFFLGYGPFKPRRWPGLNGMFPLCARGG